MTSDDVGRFVLRRHGRTRLERPRSPSDPLSRGAGLLLLGVAGAATAAALLSLTAPAPDAGEWLTFAALGACAAVAQYLIIPTGKNQGFPVSVVFLVAAALLLPPQLVALMGVAQHLPDAIGRRYTWYITGFNAANYTLNALAAWAVADLIGATGLEPDLRWAAAGAAAALVLVALNHVALAAMLRLARSRTLRESGLLSPIPLLADLALAGLGVALARFWLDDPYLIPLVVAPLVLIQRSFALVARLGESEERFRAMFEGAPTGTIVTDLDGRIVSCNRAFEDLVGYGRRELVRRRLAELDHEEDREVDRGLFTGLAAGERERYAVEKRLVRRDGTAAWGHVAVSLVRDAQGRPRFAIVMVEDLTERTLLEEQLRHAQKMEAVGQLAGGVAHDFNNLLTIILGRSRFALRQVHDADHAIGTDLEEIAGAAERAASLTQQLLAFSRRQVLQPRVVDLNAVVRAIDRMLGRLIGEDVEIVTELAPDLGRVRADPGQLEQVILNLAVNARDAMPGGGRLTIRTANVELDESFAGADRRPAPGDYVLLAVVDTGQGMDEATRSHAFEPFFTTKEPGKGTGLGLSTVYGIVAQSGGYLHVESELGRGSSLAVYLPRVHAELAPGAAEAKGRPGVLTGSETVLLVEDDEGVLALTELVLTRHGYTVLTAADGAEALRLVEEHPAIDLLLTDVIMPTIGGPELARMLVRARPGLRVLYISGYAGDTALPQDPAGAVVAKPFEEETLARMVREALDRVPGEEPPSVEAPAASGPRSVATP